MVRIRLRQVPALLTALGAIAIASHACEHTPLLAPSGSAITITAVPTALSTDSVEVSALVQEGKTATTTGQNGQSGQSTTAGGGTPVHNGTLVTFTTTLGTISPSEARTVDGRVTVTFIGDGRAGKATITATSGSATKTFDLTLTEPQ